MNVPSYKCMEFCPLVQECDLARKASLVGRDMLVRQVMSQAGMGVDTVHVNKGFYEGSGGLEGTEITDAEAEELARILGGTPVRIPKSDDPQENALAVLGKNHTDYDELMAHSNKVGHSLRELRAAQPGCKGPKISLIGQLKELKIKAAMKGLSPGKAPFKRKHYERELRKVHLQNLRERSVCRNRSARSASRTLRKTPLMRKLRGSTI